MRDRKKEQERDKDRKRETHTEIVDYCMLHWPNNI